MDSISVIIPVYNGGRFIAQALRSVAGQSLAPLETIVVDDGSTDNTEEEVAGFTGAMPLVYRRQERRGAGAARNLAASLARGDWLGFLDADDLWHPDKLAAQFEFVAHHPDVPFFYADVDWIDESGEVLVRRWASDQFVEQRPDSRRRLSRLVFSGRPFPLPSTVLMKRELFERAGGFNTAFDGKYHEDFEFFARLAEMAPMCFIGRSLAGHRRHGSQSAAAAEMDRKNWLLFLDCMWRIWQGAPGKQALLVRYFAKHYADQAKWHLRAGNYADARRYCRLAAGYQPFSFTNLRHWGLALLPVARNVYSTKAARQNARAARAQARASRDEIS